MRKTLTNNLTLIELMIMIAIIGMITLITIIHYRDHWICTKVTKGLNLANAAKLAVSKAIVAEGNKNLNQIKTNYIFKSSSNTQEIKNIEILDHGIITITYNDIGADINQKTLKLVPKITNLNTITWICLAKTNKLSKIKTMNMGTLPEKYAPSNCRH